ncbi:MAG: FHA domain-containing protein [Kiritimatiellae bacterium]|nr:FHA domain-containing protein [Kiritimatiellia bacterium]
MFKLILVSGEPRDAEYILKPGENIVGRSRSVEIKVSAMDVSGRHARLLLEGGVVMVENLSQYGTFLDTEPVEGRVEMKPGSLLKIGKTTELQLKYAGESTGESTGESRGEKCKGETFFAPTLTVDAGYGDDDDDDDDDDEGATRTMQTRAATPDEIQTLKDHEVRRAKRKVIVIIGAIAVLLAIGVIFRPRRPPPELEIEWPKNKQGAYQHRFEPGPSGGIAKGEYDLRYPDNGTFKKGELVGGYMFSGFVGRDLNVPVRIFLQEEVDLRLASMTQPQIVSDWIEMVSGGGGVWRFNEPSTLAIFFGEKNGIPYTRVTYLRDDNGSWFGVASVFRHGRRRIVARAEAPANEQVRVENMLSSRLIYVADELEFSYWPYTQGLSALSVKDELDEVRHDLERMAPGTWMSLDKQLCALLSRVVPQEDAVSEKESLRLLSKLRESEALWFNSQQLSFESCKLSGDLKMARKVSVFTKGVFSEMSDQRYYTVRKWNLEL